MVDGWVDVVLDGWVDELVVGLSKTNVNLGGGADNLSIYYRGTDNLSTYFREGGDGRKTLINTLKEGRTISI